MTPTIATFPEKKLVGKRLTMSFAHYNVAQLWRSFMPHRAEIGGTVNNDLISVAVYSPNYFTDFNPNNEFERWATIEVEDFTHVPASMETLIIPSGLYAVFHYQGLNTDSSIFQHILGTWLPTSGYTLDSRPHFEILGEKYKNNDPTSEEDICIPISNETL